MEALEICKRPVVLFDFDGTVADTGRAVMTSTRKTLAARGFSEAQMGDLRRMIGPPLWKSFHDFYGFTREESLVVADEYRAFFDELGPEEYPVFDGIPELLDGLVAQGHRLAVATSRMEAKCIDMVHELGLSQFEAVVGMNPPQGRETKADSVRDALAALGAAAGDAVMMAAVAPLFGPAAYVRFLLAATLVALGWWAVRRPATIPLAGFMALTLSVYVVFKTAGLWN